MHRPRDDWARLRRCVLPRLLALGCAFVTLAAAGTVAVLPVTGPIGPATADFVVRGIERAQKDAAPLIVLRLDTPGGLDTSMREIIKAILASPVPVAAYVAPSGARAASAGTYILYASHVAAMAPGTNLGAATPVQIGGSDAAEPASGRGSGNDAKGEDASRAGTLARKQTHDAAAYIRGLAQLRGRNAEWAERAVREAVSLSAGEAVEQRVVDFVAADVAELLAKAEGRKVATVAGEKTLETRGLASTTFEPDWRSRLLAIITDPSIALLLMMLGTYGLFFEFSHPGTMLPGVVGAIALVLGLFALNMLPVNYAGLTLIVLGLGFMVAEGFLPAYGSLGIGGIVAFIVGAVMLIDTDTPGFGIPLSVIVAIAVIGAGGIMLVSALALKARRRPVLTGSEQMLGSRGVMLEDADCEGWARVRSESWRVRSAVPLKRGQSVQVTARLGLLLIVAPVAEAPALAKESP